MTKKIIYEQRPYFLPWVAAMLDRPQYDETARTIASVDVKPDGSEETLAVVVFSKWSTLKHVELDIASNGKVNWCSPEFCLAVYDYAFIHAGCSRLNFIAEVSNQSALNMHMKLSHVQEGILREWFGPGRDAVIFGFTRKDFENSRLQKRRIRQG